MLVGNLEKFRLINPISIRSNLAVRELVLSVPSDATEETRAEAFFAVRYYKTINSIMQEAVSMTATQKASSRNIVLLHPDESPVEAS